MPGDYYIAHLNTGNHQLIWTDLSVDDLVNYIVKGKDKIYIANYSYESAEEALEESKLFCTNGLDELKFTVELNANREITKLFHINDIALTTSPIKLTAYSRSSYYISDDNFDEKILTSVTTRQQTPHVFFTNVTEMRSTQKDYEKLNEDYSKLTPIEQQFVDKAIFEVTNDDSSYLSLNQTMINEAKKQLRNAPTLFATNHNSSTSNWSIEYS